MATAKNIDNTDIQHSISGIELLNPQQYYVFGLIYDSYEAKYGHIPVDFDILIHNDLESISASVLENHRAKTYKVNKGQVAIYYNTYKSIENADEISVKHYILINSNCSIYNFVNGVIWALGSIVGHETLYRLDWFISVDNTIESKLTLSVMSEYFSWSTSCSILSDIDKQRGIEWEDEAKQSLNSENIEFELITYAKYIAICDSNNTNLGDISQRLRKVIKQLSGTWDNTSKITYKAFNKLRKYIKKVVEEDAKDN